MGGSHGPSMELHLQCNNRIILLNPTKSRRCGDVSCLDPAMWRLVILNISETRPSQVNSWDLLAGQSYPTSWR